MKQVLQTKNFMIPDDCSSLLFLSNFRIVPRGVINFFFFFRYSVAFHFPLFQVKEMRRVLES